MKTLFTFLLFVTSLSAFSQTSVEALYTYVTRADDDEQAIADPDGTIHLKSAFTADSTAGTANAVHRSALMVFQLGDAVPANAAINKIELQVTIAVIQKEDTLTADYGLGAGDATSIINGNKSTIVFADLAAVGIDLLEAPGDANYISIPAGTPAGDTLGASTVNIDVTDLLKNSVAAAGPTDSVALIISPVHTMDNKNVGNFKLWAHTQSNPALRPKLILDLATGINSIASDEFRVVPNPATDKIRIMGVDNGQEIRVYNITGGMVLSSTVNVMDISSLSPGIYFVRSGHNGQKIVVQ